ncbi:hypothetical protein QJS10_CPA09g01296 [Acorus calamus]|uniref:Uncharacterized protein n=1 Tax=Acorus calamus TaxID=4465 RepID=A0AAV9E5K0_ACOCL|nr:hypothetical protein QJS10_CPA09g01296 [Acorus calamus]
MAKRLFKAAQQGDFNDLAGTGDDVLEATDLAENTALHVAVMTGRDDFAKDLCKRCPSLLMKENIEGNTPLHCALKSMRDESLFIFFINAFLLLGQQRGFKANRDRESLLFLAADRSSLECVNLLLQSGVPSDSVGPNDWTALHAAVFRRNKEIAKVLLQNDPELNRKKDASGNTPLHYAAAYGDLEMVTCILDMDEDVVTYELNKDKHSPLHVAAGCGGVDIVKALVERCPGCVMLKDNKRGMLSI